MIGIGIVFIFVALLLYTTAVWTEKFKKKLETWIVIVFGSGFLCDLVGTSIMFYVSKTRFSFEHIHTLAGYSALLIMLLHLGWAILSFKYKKYEIYFTRFSIVAWSVWMFAFFSGIVLKYYGI